MIRVTDIILPIDHEDPALPAAVARELGVTPADIHSLVIAKKSVDARKKQDIKLVYVVDVELDASVHPTSARISPTPRTSYTFTVGTLATAQTRPIVVGAGPCGLFAALLLARLGLHPLLIERGKPMDERSRDVRNLWDKGLLQAESNALFGEGGAGAFSDGKLTTQIKDRFHRRSYIMDALIDAGAPESIRYDSRPHIGTDKLAQVVPNLRKRIIEAGGEVRFNACVTDVLIEEGQLRGIIVNGTEELETAHLLLAIGHSARDTYAMLHARGVAFEQKAFSIGARIEHPQELVNLSQFGQAVPHARLGPAEYKLAHHCANGRSVYSFCMCPGGQVIGIAHEPETVVTNGMSYHARHGRNANSGLLVGITPADFGDPHPLAGITFQRQWEHAAYRLGGGDLKAPAQRVGDLLAGRATKEWGTVEPTYRPGVVPADLRECLPEYVITAWREAIPALGRKMRHFDMPDAVLCGVETRSSAPVRMSRLNNGESTTVRGLYPGGEGAGYAGGIVSAAMDGMGAAEHMARALTGVHEFSEKRMWQ